MTTVFVRAVLSSMLLAWHSAWATDVEQPLEAWLDANNQRVVAFLRSLPEGAVDSELRGVKLTDGTLVLAGYKYLGQVRAAGPGVHVHLFSDGGTRVAYIWIDPSGASLSLPNCDTGPSDDEPATVLSGDVYTFKDLQAGGGIVVFRCANEVAWRGWVPDKTVQPTRAAGPNEQRQPAARSPGG